MFKTKKTRMLEEAVSALTDVTEQYGQAVAAVDAALKLAKDNAELHERSMRLADHWKFMYEVQEKQNARLTFTPELEARLDKAFLKACGVTSLDELPVN